MRRFADEQQVSEITGVAVKTLRRWRVLGTGPEFRKFGSSVRYDLDQLDRWIQQCPSGGASVRVSA